MFPSVGSLQKCAEKESDENGKMNTQLCFEKTTRDENRQNIVRALKETLLANVAISMPQISEQDDIPGRNLGRNYNLLR